MATWDDFKILKKLGAGGFSDVFLAQNNTTGDICALKIMMRTEEFSEEYEAYMSQEIETMKELNHPNIINLLKADLNVKLQRIDGVSFDVCYLALEVATGGDLFDYIAQTGRFTEDITRFYMHQMIDAFNYMNIRGISHRDIKPDNILLDNEFNIKISDFGWASHKSKNTTQAGTKNYMAPEIQIMDNYSPIYSDIFSIAVVMFIMVAGHPPFAMPSSSDKHYNAIWANRDDLFWKWHTKKKAGGMSFFSQEFMELISSMLQLDPTTRPSLAEICNHPWVLKKVPSKTDVIIEFERRQQVISQSNLQLDQEIPKEEAGPTAFKEKIKRDITASEDNKLEEGSKEPELYVPSCKRVTQFFSTSSLHDLYNTLAVFASKQSEDFRFSLTSYSVEINFIKGSSKLSMTVNILKCEDKDKYCIEALRNSGDYASFNEMFKIMLTYFGGHSNATEE